jgi:hyaluronan synthase
MIVVIPAYNEGEMVAKTIESCAQADYPAGRLEIIAIDDGSTDDTWQHILAAAAGFPHLVRTIRFKANQGKRAALAAGFEQAGGEIILTVDSDSVLEKSTLLAIAGPFTNPKIGAVGGKVAVLNRRSGLLARMLHVRFVLSFDFLRSAQSAYGTVYCCPGALTAYRASVLKQVVPRWSRQTFLGAPCTIGEDRALTNDVLDAGYDAVYQGTAVVHTLVPESYGKLCRMYLRWDRSYIREELRLARIVWRRPLVPRLFTILDKTLTNLRYPVGYATIALALAMSLEDPWTLLRMLLAIGLSSLFYSLFFLRSERSWDFLWGVAYAYFSSFALLWIFPWALLTVRARSWLTR